MASADAPQSLRLRRKGSPDTDDAPPPHDDARPRKTDEVVWAKTPSGEGKCLPAIMAHHTDIHGQCSEGPRRTTS